MNLDELQVSIDKLKDLGVSGDTEICGVYKFTKYNTGPRFTWGITGLKVVVDQFGIERVAVEQNEVHGLTKENTIAVVTKADNKKKYLTK